MRVHRLSLSFFAPLAAAGVLVGCGSSSSNKTTSTTTADKTAFCAANSKLDKATLHVTTPAQALSVLKANSATVDEFARTTPAAIKTQADILVNDTRAAIAANNPSILTADAKFAHAGPAVDAFCGQSHTGEPVSTATTSTSSTGTGY